MAERGNGSSTTAQPATTTTEKPSIPNAGDFRSTPGKPYSAATDSGYKIYPNQTFTVSSLGGSGQTFTKTGLKLEGPGGNTLGYLGEGSDVWANPQGNGPADQLSGLKPDPAWSDFPTSVEKPELKDPEPEPPHDVTGWTPTTAEPWVLKDPTQTLYWDTKKSQYTWIDTDGARHVGPKRPPDKQVKKAYSGGDDDE